VGFLNELIKAVLDVDSNSDGRYRTPAMKELDNVKLSNRRPEKVTRTIKDGKTVKITTEYSKKKK
jgi:major membrane immunogen (membrane-anchored lipoprotein)